MTPGDALEPRSYAVRRADLVRYAGASGDFNPIHWSDRIATAVGLPGVIAHGMFTMALVARAVDEWTGGAEVVELGCKFTNPVVVPDDDEGVVVEIGGTVKSRRRRPGHDRPRGDLRRARRCSACPGRSCVPELAPRRLSDHTTLRLGGPAARWVEATTEAELVEAVGAADAAGEPVLVLGGGSNLVVADGGFAGTVVHVATRGIDVRPGP